MTDRDCGRNGTSPTFNISTAGDGVDNTHWVPGTNGGVPSPGVSPYADCAAGQEGGGDCMPSTSGPALYDQSITQLIAGIQPGWPSYQLGEHLDRLLSWMGQDPGMPVTALDLYIKGLERFRVWPSRTRVTVGRLATGAAPRKQKVEESGPRGCYTRQLPLSPRIGPGAKPETCPAGEKGCVAEAFALSVLSMTDVTRILAAVERGDLHAAGQLLPLVYDELRKLAAQKLAREKVGQTLQATALVHEAYVRLVGRGETAGGEPRWDSRGHFFTAAAEAMRRILIDRAREKRAEKRGGNRKRLDIDAIDLATTAAPDQLLALDEALAKLARGDPATARLVELRYFAGLTVEDAGKALGMSAATAYRHWNYARAWLHGELLGTEGA